MEKCEMFCYQCQETARGTGCTKVGVCGKRPELSSMLDLLIYVTKGLSCVTTKLREEGKEVGKDVNHLVSVNLFTTITNANFDRDAIIARIKDTLEVKEELRAKLADPDALPKAALWNGSEKEYDTKADSNEVGVLSAENEDIRSLREMITYGLKGLSAYSKHANALMQDNEAIDAFIQSALAKILDDSLSVDDLVVLTLETGKFGVDGMALLDSANTGAYGNPEITEVNIGVRNNPGILISGHDLKDLEQLLEQTKGSGVDVYTHSEMLPAHYYPAFKKYDHFVGNYGNAWWKQKEEFETFNGPILMTTNCIVPPADSYKDRLWTTGAAGYPGCRHIEGEYGAVKDFSDIIAQAKTCAPPQEIETGSIVGGFAHEQVFALADKVVEAIKSGAIRKFVVMAGCDGRMRSREYYKEFAEKRDYKFNFLSDQFFEVLSSPDIFDFDGIFIALAKGKMIYHDKNTPSDYIIKTATAEEKTTSNEAYCVAWHYGIKISHNLEVEFACVFGAHACGYGAVRVFKTIGEDTWSHHQWSINNIVNYMAVPMVYDEIVFDD